MTRAILSLRTALLSSTALVSIADLAKSEAIRGAQRAVVQAKASAK